MAEMYYEEDADLSLIQDKNIGIIGYGSQGHAHALNLKDTGLNVQIGLYEGSKSWAIAEKDGFTVKTASDVAKDSDIIMLLLHDHSLASSRTDFSSSSNLSDRQWNSIPCLLSANEGRDLRAAILTSGKSSSKASTSAS